MTRQILSLRINRRAIGAAILAGDALTFCDGRHLTSSKERAVPAAVRYVHRLLEQSNPVAVVCDAPTPDEPSTTTELLKAIVEHMLEHGLTPIVVRKADIVGAYGLDPLPTRQDVRDVVEGFWPDIMRRTGRVKPYAADAAAAALYAECRLALRPTPS